MDLSVVLPAYNESENLDFVLDELISIISTIEEITDYEIIVVDDHSEDGTFDLIEKKLSKSIKCIRLSRRSGSHTALRAGIRHSQGDLVLCISADGQDQPEVLQKMINKIIHDKYDVVWAVRKSREESILYKLFAGSFYRILTWMTKIEHLGFEYSKADFYLFNRKIANAINDCNERNTSLFGLILWLGFKQGFVEYDRRNRYKGKSKWSYHALFHLAKDWIIAFSGIPLKLISIVGFIIAMIGFLYALFIFIYALFGNTIPGWAATAILILTIGGIQLVMLGIIGEYLFRNLDETRKRPLYFLEKTTENN